MTSVHMESDANSSVFSEIARIKSDLANAFSYIEDLRFNAPRPRSRENYFPNVNHSSLIIPSVVMKWDGGTGVYSTCRPALEAGKFWYLDDVTVSGFEFTYWMKAICLPMYDVAGYCPSTGTTSFVDSNGDAIEVSLASGLVDVVANPALIGTTIAGINSETGTPASVTVQADGKVTGFEGQMRVVDPSTGESTLHRIGSDGMIRG